ncbi:MAG TPA: hypothetical protein VMT16_09685 [Thermoanaerobaculia bacterium]|nr:hypothetical protein [Thermoanaerobaculia bacterium]
MSSRRPFRRSLATAALSLACLGGGCGSDDPAGLPPPQVDLLARAEAVAEVIDARLLDEYAESVGRGSSAQALQRELRRLGLAPAGSGDRWGRVFVERHAAVAPVGGWVFRRQDRQVALGAEELAVASGVEARRVRLRGAEMVFVGRALPAAGEYLAGKLLLASVDDEGLRRALVRRAAAVDAAGVLLLPSPAEDGFPGEAAVRELASGSGLPVVAALTEGAAQTLLRELLETSLEYFLQLAARPGFEPLVLDVASHLVLERTVATSRGSNLVALRAGRQETAPVVVVLATHPAVAPPVEEGDAPPAPEGAAERPAAAVLGAAQALAVARALQALPAPPLRSVLFAFVAPGEAGRRGARHLLEHPVVEATGVAAVVAFADDGPGHALDQAPMVAAPDSPIAALVAEAAAGLGRRVLLPPSPADWLMRSPAWSLAGAGAPSLVLLAGRTAVPERLAAPPPAVERFPGDPPAVVRERPEPLLPVGVAAARLGFRVTLELAERDRPLPRIEPQELLAALQAVAPQQPTADEPAPRPAVARGSGAAAPRQPDAGEGTSAATDRPAPPPPTEGPAPGGVEEAPSTPSPEPTADVPAERPPADSDPDGESGETEDSAGEEQPAEPEEDGAAGEEEEPDLDPDRGG